MSKHIGQVKWFNNKIGYGFITLLNEETQKDVFEDHMNICPLESNYRTLKIGEYVEFELMIIVKVNIMNKQLKKNNRY